MNHRRSASQADLDIKQFGKNSGLLLKAFQASQYGQHFLTHKFHAYPGRFHPKIAHTLFQEVGKANQSVFDPFMGGGTVLVEGMLKNLKVFGNDLNPIACLIAKERTRLIQRQSHVVSHAKRIAERVTNSQKFKYRKKFNRPHLQALRQSYPPHLFVEALEWIEAIDGLQYDTDKQTLQAVFSSLVVKYSYYSSDSSSQVSKQPIQYPKGAFSRMMISKTQELVEAQTKFSKKVGFHANSATVFCQNMSHFQELQAGTMDFILSSPPYPGTYDYYQQHQLRMQWLNLVSESFQKGELGAKRFGVSGKWREQFRQVLLKLRRILKPSGSCYLVMGDWAEGKKPVSALDYMKKYADSVGFCVSSAVSIQRACHSSQQAQVFENQGRWEHLIHLTR